MASFQDPNTASSQTTETNLPATQPEDGSFQQSRMPASFRVALTALTLSALSLSGVIIYRALHSRTPTPEKFDPAKHLALWGTMEKPAFTIVKSDGYAPVRTFQHRQSEGIKGAEDRFIASQNTLIELLRLESVIRKAETQELNTKTPEFIEAAGAIVNLRKRFLPSIEELEGVPQLQLTVITGDEFAPRYGKPEQYARELFRELTGKELPPEVEVTIGNTDEARVLGQTHEFANKTRLRPGEYYIMVGAGLHEFGHLISQVNEHAFLTTPEHANDFEIGAREEACAMIFADSGVALIQDDSLRSLVHPVSYNFANNYYSDDEHASRLHSRGGALADAAETLYGNYPEAYQHMAGDPELDPRIFELISQNRELYARGLVAQDQASSAFEQVLDMTRDLAKRLKVVQGN